jgi:hypothetical protein
MSSLACNTSDNFKLATNLSFINKRRHDTQHNDIQHNDTQHKELFSDIQYATQHNDTQHEGLMRDIQHNATQHNDTAIMLNVIVLSVKIYLLLC